MFKVGHMTVNYEQLNDFQKPVLVTKCVLAKTAREFFMQYGVVCIHIGRGVTRWRDWGPHYQTVCNGWANGAKFVSGIRNKDKKNLGRKCLLWKELTTIMTMAIAFGEFLLPCVATRLFKRFANEIAKLLDCSVQRLHFEGSDIMELFATERERWPYQIHISPLGYTFGAVLGGARQMEKPVISGCMTRMRMVQAPPQSMLIVARGQPHVGPPYGRLAKFFVSEVLQLHMGSLLPERIIPDPLDRTKAKQLKDLDSFRKLIRIGEHATMETSTFIFGDNELSPRATNKKVYHIDGTGFEKAFFSEEDERATLDCFITVHDILTSTPRRLVDAKALEWLVERKLADAELMKLESAQVYPGDDDTADFVHLEQGPDGLYFKRARAPPDGQDRRDSSGSAPMECDEETLSPAEPGSKLPSFSALDATLAAAKPTAQATLMEDDEGVASLAAGVRAVQLLSIGGHAGRSQASRANSQPGGKQAGRAGVRAAKLLSIGGHVGRSRAIHASGQPSEGRRAGIPGASARGDCSWGRNADSNRAAWYPGADAGRGPGAAV